MTSVFQRSNPGNVSSQPIFPTTRKSLSLAPSYTAGRALAGFSRTLSPTISRYHLLSSFGEPKSFFRRLKTAVTLKGDSDNRSFSFC